MLWGLPCTRGPETSCSAKAEVSCFLRNYFQSLPKPYFQLLLRSFPGEFLQNFCAFLGFSDTFLICPVHQENLTANCIVAVGWSISLPLLRRATCVEICYSVFFFITSLTVPSKEQTLITQGNMCCCFNRCMLGLVTATAQW